MPTFEVEDLLLERRIDGMHAVAAHDLAVAAVKQPDGEGDAYRSAIWLFPLDGSAPPRQLTAGTARDGTPRWSPDGQRVAFLSDRAGGLNQVFLIQADGGEARQLSHFEGGVSSLEWSPDGRRLLLTCVVHVDPEERGEGGDDKPPRDPDAPELAWRLPFKSNGIGYLLGQQVHLFVLEVDSGADRQLTRGAFEVRAAAWSPDGARIAYTRTREGRFAHRTDLWLVEADGSRGRQLSREQANVATPQWSPDGRTIAFAGNVDDGDAQMRLWLLDAAGGPAQPLGDDGLEVVAGTNPCWRPDGTALRVLLAQQGRQHLVEVDVPAGTRRTLVGGERHLGAIAVGRSRLGFCAEDAAHALEVYACAPDGSGEQRLGDLNGWWRERPTLQAAMRRFTVPDGQGGQEEIEAWVLHAQGRSGPMPLLLDVHGGPASYADLSFQNHPFWPVLCARGWLVVVPNPVGSSSYGRPFAERLRGHWGERDLPQHLAVIEALQAEGLADAQRVALTGSSYGGYMAAWAIGNCRTFRAAVVCAPVTNLETHYGTSDSGYYSDPYSMRGEPHLDRATSQRLSPMKHVHRALTPTLILQGKEDERCPKCQSEELFVSLMCATPAPCEMVLYPGGDHHVLKDGKPSHRLDGIRRLVDWVTRWVEQPLPKDGGTARERDGPAARSDRG